MIIEDVIAKLEAFVPSEEIENVGYLYDILRPLERLAPELRSPVIPAILSLIERNPDAELGSPGPLVHELEAIPAFEPFLRGSVLRQPTELSIWMVNRILNSEISHVARADWLAVLSIVKTHPLASNELRQSAADFLEYQGS